MTAPVLATRELSKNFGALMVARDIDFALEKGARHALIGPNGAGKTSLINLIAGVLAPSFGAVLLNGDDITRSGQAERVKLGVARTFQINQLFRGLTVLENACLPVAERRGTARVAWRPLAAYPEIAEEALAVLATLELEDDALTPVGELPYGRQRLVEIAIALASRPQVLLLDEPAAGVPSAERHIILDVLDGLPEDIAVLIVDHAMDVVFRFAREITVMVGGAILTGGPPEAIAADERVRAVYLGQAGDSYG